MQIAPTTLAQAIAPESAAPSSGGRHSFEATLKAEQNRSQAPPGKEPPSKASPPSPDQTKGGEVAKPEPNAQSQKPDSQPTVPTGKPSKADKAASPPSADAQTAAASAVAMIPAHIVLPPDPTQVSASSTASGDSSQTPSTDVALVPGGAQAPAPVADGDHEVLAASSQTGLPATSKGDHIVKNQPKGRALGIDNRMDKELGIKDVTVKVRQGSKTAKEDQSAVQTEDGKPSQTSYQKSTDPTQPQAKAPVGGKDSGTPAVTNESEAQSGQAYGQSGSGQGDQSRQSRADAPASSLDPDVKADVDVSQAKAGPFSVPVQGASRAVHTDVVMETSLTPRISQAQTSMIVRQAADRIALLTVARSKAAVTVHLSPPDLGDLTIVVRASGSRVDADITASNDAVKQALQQHAGQLGHSLAQRGLELNSVSVGTQGNCSTQGDSTAKQNAYANNRNNPSVNGLPHEAVVPDGQPSAHTSTSGVDLKI